MLGAKNSAVAIRMRNAEALVPASLSLVATVMIAKILLVASRILGRNQIVVMAAEITGPAAKVQSRQ